MFRCFNGNAEEATRSRERREYLESIKRIGAPFGASIVNDGYSGRKRQLAGTRRGIHAVLDQQSENDRKQNGEKKPSFHGRECATGIRQVNSGSSINPLPSSALRKSAAGKNATLRPRVGDRSVCSRRHPFRSVGADVDGAEAVTIRRRHTLGHIAAGVDIADAEAAEMAMMETAPAPAAEGLGRCGGRSKGGDAERSRGSQYDCQFA